MAESRIPGDEKLKTYARRLSALFSEIDALQEDVKQVKAEAKEAGFNAGVLAKAAKYTMKTDDERERADEIFDLFAYYCRVIGVEPPTAPPRKKPESAPANPTTH